MFCLIKFELDKLFIFRCGFLSKSELHISCLIKRMEKFTEINTFRIIKMTLIFHIFDQTKVSRVPL